MNIFILLADLLCVGLFVIGYYVIFDDTEFKEKERKKKIDAITGRKD